jgi:hypothetical protein
MSDEPKVEIGLREIYDAVQNLIGIVKGHPDKLDDHEKRIRALEYRVWTTASAATIIAVVVSKAIPSLWVG